MIPENHKTAIISTGMHFMRSITEAYGAETGMELWEQIASVLDPDVKGQIFFAMITGKYNDRIILRGLTSSAVTARIACIKELRVWSGLGLKEAKDIVDSLAMEHGPKSITVRPENYSSVVDKLSSVGFVI